MGQYHKVFNIDKKECLEPWNFGCGAKIAEWCSGTSPVSKATMMLLACSNGRGGGDFQEIGSSAAWHGFAREEQYKFSIPKICSNIKGLPLTIIGHKNNYYTVDTSKIYGRWAGDRVIVIGDYADEITYVMKCKLNNGKEDTQVVPAKLLYSLCGETKKSLIEKRTDDWIINKGVDNLWDYYVKTTEVHPDVDLSSLICKDVSLPMRLCLEAENYYYEIPKRGFFDDPCWDDEYIDFYEEKDKDKWKSINRLDRKVKNSLDKEFFKKIIIHQELEAGEVSI